MTWLINVLQLLRLKRLLIIGWWMRYRDVDMCDMSRSYAWHDSLICVTWLIDVCIMTHRYVWHDSLTCAWHDSLTCVTWLIDVRDMTHWFVWHVTRMNESRHAYEWVMSHVWTSLFIVLSCDTSTIHVAHLRFFFYICFWRVFSFCYHVTHISNSCNIFFFPHIFFKESSHSAIMIHRKRISSWCSATRTACCWVTSHK